MEKVLVAGAAGFIGSFVSMRLISDDYHVVGVDNLNDYYDVRLKDWRLGRLSKNKNFEFYQADVENREVMEVLFKLHSFDSVLNLAAQAGVRYSLENPLVCFNSNTSGTVNLLQLCSKYGVKKFVLSSTSSLYAGQEVPFSEGPPVDTPRSPYAASKRAAELAAYVFHHLYGMDVSVLRYFTVYGPAGRPDMSYFRFIKRIMQGVPLEVNGDGSQLRDFTFIEDLVEGTCQAIKPLGYQVINLGSGRPVSMLYLIHTLESLLGEKARINYKPFHSADMPSTWADISRASALLGWKPGTALEQGLSRTVEWFRQNWDWVKDINC